MNEWIVQSKIILKTLTAMPDSRLQLLVMLAVAVVSAFVVMRLTIGVCGFEHRALWRSFIVFFLWLVLPFSAAVALRVYAIEHISQPAVKLAVQIAVPVLLLLVIVAPIQLLLQKGGYFGTIANMLLSAFAACMLAALVHAAWDAAVTGGSSVDKMKESKADINEI